MTTITIQFARPRGNRLSILAMSIGVSLVIWAEDRAKLNADHDEQSRRLANARGIQSREHSALRLAQLRP
jgi:hypothetical protein